MAREPDTRFQSRTRLSHISVRVPSSSPCESSGLDAAAARVGVDIEELERELHAADAVGESMVHLHDQCRASAFEPFHQCELPQGMGVVERRHRGVAGESDDGRGSVRCR